MRISVVGAALLVAAGSVVAYGMLSGPSYSDGPMPSVRDALGCDSRTYLARQLDKAGQTGEPSPEAALQSGWNALALAPRAVPSREDWEAKKSAIGRKVAKAGRDLDAMLDMLEGQPDTLPE